MSRRIAVLVRSREEEALRMSLGLTLVDDTVDVYVLDRKLEQIGPAAAHLELIREMEMVLYSNRAENKDMEILSIDEIARRLPEYDHVLPY